MCKLSKLTLIRVEMTLEEAEAIIVDPASFVSNLQDMLPAPSLRDAAPKPRASKPRRKYTLDKVHCNLCDRDITASRFAKHQAKYQAEA